MNKQNQQSIINLARKIDRSIEETINTSMKIISSYIGDKITKEQYTDIMEIQNRYLDELDGQANDLLLLVKAARYEEERLSGRTGLL
jgi:hypothetical protein